MKYKGSRDGEGREGVGGREGAEEEWGEREGGGVTSEHRWRVEGGRWGGSRCGKGKEGGAE